MKKKSVLTKEGYEKLKNELDHLKTTKRREISRAIGEAIKQGDISENAEYDAAKDEQAHIEKRIAELEEKLAQAQIIDQADMPADIICIGKTVELLDIAKNDKIEYTLVDPSEADFKNGKISIASPVGKGLVGRKAGDETEIEVPSGLLKYKVLEIKNTIL